MGLREAKRERARETVVKVAYRLFREHGYDDTTVEMIASEAYVSPRTFYRYFETKDGVLAEGGYTVIDAALERLDGDRRLASLVATMAEVYDELVQKNDFREHARLLRENPGIADRAPAWRQRWGDYLAARLADQAEASEPSRQQRIDSAVAVHIVATAVDEWLYGNGAVSVSEVAREVLDQLRESLDVS